MFNSDLYENPNMFDMFQRPSDSDQTERDDDNNDTKSGTEVDAPSADDDNQGPASSGPSRRRAKRKRYHRHTQRQIQEMEALFKECPHPDDKQRKQLSRELGLDPLQVKFWFQNKRTQLKAQTERHENGLLKAENEKLRAENHRYKEALNNASCPTCGGPAALGEMSFEEQHLRLENARLREEIERISGVTAKYVGKPIGPSFSRFADRAPISFGTQPGFLGEYGGPGGAAGGPGVGAGGPGGGLGEVLRPVSVTNEADRPLIVELAVTAMEELIRMAQSGEPLWVTDENSIDVLNENEYLRIFPRGIGSKPFANLGFRSEASREAAVIIMNPVNLVEILMDVNQWSTVFCGIVSRAMTLDVLSTGVAGNYNGALQVMTAEFQLPSPLVPTRENYFARYCKRHHDGIWAVVDVSLDNLRHAPFTRCRRRPSGCLIQELPNGYSKVIWVENVEVDDRGVSDIYKTLVNTSLAFGAKRWVATLDRQCERLASAMANNIPAGDLGVLNSSDGRKSILKLAERMVNSFCTGVGASTAHAWTTLTGSDEIRVMTRKSIDDPGRPPGIVLSAATSFWVAVPPRKAFNILRSEKFRSEWDILSNGGVVDEMAHIANGRDPGNCVSLLRVNGANASQSNMLILQESSNDATGSYVIYAPVDFAAMNIVLNGGDPNYVALLPSGFAILPDREGPNRGIGITEIGSGGSLVTLAFQILVDSAPNSKISVGSVATVNSLIKCTLERIRTAVMCNDA
ncbi:hypothetical protein E1A91_A10G015700v1 [Gossypium mustelinum]|uniref:Homeobox domain-containing protein n=1 Tax=Gossypium mustelinum TaxID=34275 RepID=A0A5D2XG94_GOSMU|nr:hypothetical protein E1A91_A10G015700v1 [Gossypium mustelinum]